MKAFSHFGFRLAYDGENFQGFQRQPSGSSVQASVERALSILLRHKIKIEFSSRTDAGVHAYDQWGMIRDGLKIFQDQSPKNQRAFLISINALLPESIRFWSIFALREDFRPHFDPLWKQYEYRILLGGASDPLWRSQSLWYYSSQDIEEMKRAFRKFEGTHDFAAFATRAHRYQEKTTRKILKATIHLKPHEFMEGSRWLVFRVRGEGFLHHMVRTMVGTVLDVGRGRIRAEQIQEILKSKKRPLAGVNAPPHPLVLTHTQVSSRFIQPLNL